MRAETRTLTLRPRQDSDLPTLWHWTHGEENPEWIRWDGPYFDDKPEPLTYAAYREKAEATPPQPNRQIIALDGECIGMVTRHEEAPRGGGRGRRFGGGPSAFLIRQRRKARS